MLSHGWIILPRVILGIMIPRSPLIILEQATRSPLKLIQEMDRELRARERRHAADPADPHARERLSRSKRRAGPPDNEHNWRWNGKGWFTRPQWNNGSCPPDTQATLHNTCIGSDATPKDKVQYREPRDGDYYQRRGSDEREQGRPAPRDGGAVNWDHPHEPKIYTPNQWTKPRPLPDNPEHLSPGLLGSRYRDFGTRSDRRREHAKLIKHYSDKGYDPNYVRTALNARQKSHPGYGLSHADLDRLPDEKSRMRARRGHDKSAARTRRDSPDPDYYDHGFDDPDMYFDNAYRRNYRQGRPGDSYPNDPGYPGHKDFPKYDAHNAPMDPPDYSRDRDDYYDRYDEPEDQEPEDSENSQSGWSREHFRAPHRWPRTGERPDRHGITNDRFTRRRR